MKGRVFSVEFTIFMIFFIIGITLGDDPSLAGKNGIEHDPFQIENSSGKDVVTVSENTRISLKNQKRNCVEYLESSLKEFMQKNTSPTNKDGTVYPSVAIEETLHQKMLELMSDCKGAQIDVKQHVVTEVDSQKRSFEQLVIQSILIKPYSKTMADVEEEKHRLQEEIEKLKNEKQLEQGRIMEEKKNLELVIKQTQNAIQEKESLLINVKEENVKLNQIYSKKMTDVEEEKHRFQEEIQKLKNEKQLEEGRLMEEKKNLELVINQTKNAIQEKESLLINANEKNEKLNQIYSKTVADVEDEKHRLKEEIQKLKYEKQLEQGRIMEEKKNLELVINQTKNAIQEKENLLITANEENLKLRTNMILYREEIENITIMLKAENPISGADKLTVNQLAGLLKQAKNNAENESHRLGEENRKLEYTLTECQHEMRNITDLLKGENFATGHSDSSAMKLVIESQQIKNNCYKLSNKISEENKMLLGNASVCETERESLAKLLDEEKQNLLESQKTNIVSEGIVSSCLLELSAETERLGEKLRSLEIQSDTCKEQNHMKQSELDDCRLNKEKLKKIINAVNENHINELKAVKENFATCQDNDKKVAAFIKNGLNLSVDSDQNSLANASTIEILKEWQRKSIRTNHQLSCITEEVKNITNFARDLMKSETKNLDAYSLHANATLLEHNPAVTIEKLNDWKRKLRRTQEILFHTNGEIKNITDFARNVTDELRSNPIRNSSEEPNDTLSSLNAKSIKKLQECQKKLAQTQEKLLQTKAEINNIALSALDLDAGYENGNASSNHSAIGANTTETQRMEELNLAQKQLHLTKVGIKALNSFKRDMAEFNDKIKDMLERPNTTSTQTLTQLQGALRQSQKQLSLITDETENIAKYAENIINLGSKKVDVLLSQTSHNNLGPNASAIEIFTEWQRKFKEIEEQAHLAKDEIKNITEFASNTFFKILTPHNGTIGGSLGKNISTFDILKAVSQELTAAALCEKQMKEVSDVVRSGYRNGTLSWDEGNDSIQGENSTIIEMLKKLRKEWNRNKKQLRLTQNEISNITNFARNFIELGALNLDPHTLHENDTPLAHVLVPMNISIDWERKLHRTKELLFQTNNEMKNITNLAKNVTVDLGSNLISNSTEDVNDNTSSLRPTPILTLRELNENLKQTKDKLLLIKEEIRKIAHSTLEVTGPLYKNINSSSSLSDNIVLLANPPATQKTQNLQQDLKWTQEQLMLTKDGVNKIKKFVMELTDLSSEKVTFPNGETNNTLDTSNTASTQNLTDWKEELKHSQKQLLLTVDEIEKVAKYAEDIIKLGSKEIDFSFSPIIHTIMAPNASAMEILQEWQRKFIVMEEQALLAKDAIKNITDFTSNALMHGLTDSNGTIGEHLDKNLSTIEILKAVHRQLTVPALCNAIDGNNGSDIESVQDWETKLKEIQEQALLAKDEINNIKEFASNKFSEILSPTTGEFRKFFDKNISTLQILTAVHHELTTSVQCEKQMKEVFNVVKSEYQNITLPRHEGNGSYLGENATAIEMLREWKTELNRNKEQLLLAQNEIENITNFARDLLKSGNQNLDASNLQANATRLEHNPVTIEKFNDYRRKLKRTQELLFLTNDEIKNITDFARNFTDDLRSNPIRNSPEEVNDTLSRLKANVIDKLKEWQDKLEKTKEKLLQSKYEINDISLSVLHLADSVNENTNATSNQSVIRENSIEIQRMKELQQELKLAQEQLLLTKDGIHALNNFERDIAALASPNMNFPNKELNDMLEKANTTSMENLTHLQGELKNSQKQLSLITDATKNIAKYAEDIINLGSKKVDVLLSETSHNNLGPNASAIEIFQEWKRKSKEIVEQAHIAKDEIKNIAEFASNTFSNILTLHNGTIGGSLGKNISTIDILKAVSRELTASALCEKQMKDVSDVVRSGYRNGTLSWDEGNDSNIGENSTVIEMLKKLRKEWNRNKEQLRLTQNEISNITNFARNFIELGALNLDAHTLHENDTLLAHVPVEINTSIDYQRKLRWTKELLFQTNNEMKNIANLAKNVTVDLGSNLISNSTEDVNDNTSSQKSTPIISLRELNEHLKQTKEKLLLIREEIRKIAHSTLEVTDPLYKNINFSSSLSNNTVLEAHPPATQKTQSLKQELKWLQEQLMLTKDGVNKIKKIIMDLTDLSSENVKHPNTETNDTLDISNTTSTQNLTDRKGELKRSQKQLLLTVDEVEEIAKYAEGIIKLWSKETDLSFSPIIYTIISPNASAMEILQEWQRIFTVMEEQSLLAKDAIKNITDFTSNTFLHGLTLPNGTIGEHLSKNLSTIEILKAVHRQLTAAALCNAIVGNNGSDIEKVQDWETKLKEIQEQALLAKDEINNIKEFASKEFSEILSPTTGEFRKSLDKNISTIQILTAVHHELTTAVRCEKQMKEVFDVVKSEYQNITLPRSEGNGSYPGENATAIQMLKEWKTELNRNKEQLLLAQKEIENITNFAKDLLKSGTQKHDASSLQANATHLEHNPVTIEKFNDYRRKLKRTQELLFLTNDEIKNITDFAKNFTNDLHSNTIRNSSEEVNDTLSSLKVNAIDKLKEWQDKLEQTKEKLHQSKDEINDIALSILNFTDLVNENTNDTSYQTVIRVNPSEFQRMNELQQELKLAQEQLLLTKDGINTLNSFDRDMVALAFPNTKFRNTELNDMLETPNTTSMQNLTHLQGELKQSQKQLSLITDAIRNIAKYAENIINLGSKKVDVLQNQTCFNNLGPNASAIEIFQEWQRKFKEIEAQEHLAKDEIKNITEFASNTFSNIIMPHNGTIGGSLGKNISTIDILKAVSRELTAAALCEKQMKEVSDVVRSGYRNGTLSWDEGNDSNIGENSTVIELLKKLREEWNRNKEQLRLTQDEISNITNFARDFIELAALNLDAYTLHKNDTLLPHVPMAMNTSIDYQRKLRWTKELLFQTNNEMKNITNLAKNVTVDLGSNLISNSTDDVNDTTSSLKPMPILILRELNENFKQTKETLLLIREEIRNKVLSTLEVTGPLYNNTNSSSSQSDTIELEQNPPADRTTQNLQQELKWLQEQLVLTKDGINRIKKFVMDLTDLSSENVSLPNSYTNGKFDTSNKTSTQNLTDWKKELKQSQKQLLQTVDEIEKIAKYAEDIIKLGSNETDFKLSPIIHTIIAPNASAMEILQEWQRKFLVMEEQALFAKDAIKNITDFTSNTLMHGLTHSNGTIGEHLDKNLSTIEILKAVHRQLTAPALCNAIVGNNGSDIENVQDWETKLKEIQEQALLAKDEINNIKEFASNKFSEILSPTTGEFRKSFDKNISTLQILTAVHHELTTSVQCEKKMKEVFDVVKLEYQNITLPRHEGNGSYLGENATAIQMLQEWKTELNRNKEQLLLAQNEIENITNFARDLLKSGNQNLHASNLQANATRLEHNPVTIEKFNDYLRKLRRTQELLLVTNNEIKSITNLAKTVTAGLESNPISNSTKDVNDTSSGKKVTPILTLRDLHEKLKHAKEKLLLTKGEIRNIALSALDLMDSGYTKTNSTSSQSVHTMFGANPSSIQKIEEMQRELKLAQEQLLLTKDGVHKINNFVRDLTVLSSESINLTNREANDLLDTSNTTTTQNLTDVQGELKQSQKQLLLTVDEIEKIAKYAEDIIKQGSEKIDISLGTAYHTILGPNASAIEILQEWQRKFKVMEEQALLAKDEIKDVTEFVSNAFSHILKPSNVTISEQLDRNMSTIEILEALHRELAAAVLCHTVPGPNTSAIEIQEEWERKFKEMQEQAFLAKKEINNIKDFALNAFSKMFTLPTRTIEEDKNVTTIEILNAVHRESTAAALCEKQMKEVFDVVKIEYKNFTLPKGEGNGSIVGENATAIQMLQEWKKELNRNKEQLLLAQDEIENITIFTKGLLKLGNENLSSFLGQPNFPLFEINVTTIEILKDLKRKLNRTQELLLLTNLEIQNISKFARDEVLPILASADKASTNALGNNSTAIDIMHAVQREFMAAKEKFRNASDIVILKLEKAQENLAFCENRSAEIANAVKLGTEAIAVAVNEKTNSVLEPNATVTQLLDQWQREIKRLRLKLANAMKDSAYWMDYALGLVLKNSNTVPTEQDRIAGLAKSQGLVANVNKVYGQGADSGLKEEEKAWDASCFLCQDQLKNITGFISAQIPNLVGNNFTAFELLQEWQLNRNAETTVYELLLNECKFSNQRYSYLYHQSVASLEDMIAYKAILDKYMTEENNKLGIQREILDTYVQKTLVDNWNAYTEKINSFPL